MQRRIMHAMAAEDEKHNARVWAPAAWVPGARRLRVPERNGTERGLLGLWLSLLTYHLVARAREAVDSC